MGWKIRRIGIEFLGLSALVTLALTIDIFFLGTPLAFHSINLLEPEFYI